VVVVDELDGAVAELLVEAAVEKDSAVKPAVLDHFLPPIL